MGYMKFDERRNQVLTVALAMAEKSDYRTIRRDDIAKRAKTATGNVSRLFETMEKLRKEIVLKAIETESLPVIAQAVIANDPLVKRKVSAELRQRALASMA